MPEQSNPDTVLLVLTSVADESTAEKLAVVLVEERLAACVSRHPVRSVYRWGDGVERDEEILLLIKTRHACWLDLQARVAQLHPYDVPELLALSAAETADSYLDWLLASTSPTSVG